MIKNVLLSGGTGVTGNAILRYLISKDVNVTVLVRKNSSRLQNIPDDSRIKIIFCNLEDYINIDSELEYGKYDAFFHLAWDGSLGKEKVDNRYNVPLQYSNIGAFIEAVELAKRIGCKKILATGSQAEYGIVDGNISEDTALNPMNAYGQAKVCAHKFGDILCEKYGISLIWVRLFSVYGPNDGAISLVDTSIKSLKERNESILYTSGEQIWNYLYSFDVAKAMFLLAKCVDKSDTFCVASKTNAKLKEYIKTIHNVVNPNVKPLLGAIERTDLLSLSVDISKLVNVTGFEEEYSFEEGIEIIANEYERNVLQ